MGNFLSQPVSSLPMLRHALVLVLLSCTSEQRAPPPAGWRWDATMFEPDSVTAYWLDGDAPVGPAGELKDFTIIEKLRLDEGERAAVAELLRDDVALPPGGDRTKCDFHADFGLQWKRGNETTVAVFCHHCAEVAGLAGVAGFSRLHVARLASRLFPKNAMFKHIASGLSVHGKSELEELSNVLRTPDTVTMWHVAATGRREERALTELQRAELNALFALSPDLRAQARQLDARALGDTAARRKGAYDLSTKAPPELESSPCEFHEDLGIVWRRGHDQLEAVFDFACEEARGTSGLRVFNSHAMAKVAVEVFPADPLFVEQSRDPPRFIPTAEELQKLGLKAP